MRRAIPRSIREDGGGMPILSGYWKIHWNVMGNRRQSEPMWKWVGVLIWPA
jgi:hypothetical protein